MLLAPGRIVHRITPLKSGTRISAGFWSTGAASVCFRLGAPGDDGTWRVLSAKPSTEPGLGGYSRYELDFVVPEDVVLGAVGIEAEHAIVDDLEVQVQQLGAAGRAELRRVAHQAFLASHEGFSSDEVLLDDRRNARFLAECRQRLPGVEAADCNWTLLNLRKAGKLKVPISQRRLDALDDYLHAGEIAARHMEDRTGMNVDRVLCDPITRAQFDAIALSACPGVDPYLLRKAALRLRKARRLRPELVVRIADWGRQVVTFPAGKVREDPDLVPERPGIYILRDPSGYLYVGESRDLRARLGTQLDPTDARSVSHYLRTQGITQFTVELHVFDKDSQARRTMVRRAYESELIESRGPRFNIRP